jgi:hypothetical protein
MSAQEFQKFHKISLVVDETAAPKSLETTWGELQNFRPPQSLNRNSAPKLCVIFSLSKRSYVSHFSVFFIIVPHTSPSPQI